MEGRAQEEESVLVTDKLHNYHLRGILCVSDMVCPFAGGIRSERCGEGEAFLLTK